MIPALSSIDRNTERHYLRGNAGSDHINLMAETKLKAVPTRLPDAVIKSRQDKATEKIRKANRKHKLGTYTDPEVRHPVLKMNEVSRRATRQVEPEAPSVTLWEFLWEKLRGR